MRDAPFWVALASVWLLAFLAFFLVTAALNSIWLICLIDVALTVGVVALVAFLRSLAPERHQSNLEILQIFFMIGLMVLTTFGCQIVLMIAGVRL